MNGVSEVCYDLSVISNMSYPVKYLLCKIYRKSYCTTPDISVDFNVGVSKMLKF